MTASAQQVRCGGAAKDVSPHVGLSERFGCELSGMDVGCDRVGAGEAAVGRKGHGRAVMPCSAMLAHSVDRTFRPGFRVSRAACVGFGRAACPTRPTCQVGGVGFTRIRSRAPTWRPVPHMRVLCARQVCLFGGCIQMGHFILLSLSLPSPPWLAPPSTLSPCPCPHPCPCPFHVHVNAHAMPMPTPMPMPMPMLVLM